MRFACLLRLEEEEKSSSKYLRRRKLPRDPFSCYAERERGERPRLRKDEEGGRKEAAGEGKEERIISAYALVNNNSAGER